MRLRSQAAVGSALVALSIPLLAGCGDSSNDEETTTQTETAIAPAVDQTKLPLGDGKYVSEPKKGSVFSCTTTFPGGGPETNGPWIDESAKTWDLSRKATVDGSVDQDSEFSDKTSGTERILSGNGLPTHPTGVFPVAADDAAYKYDRNPNSIQSYTLEVSLPKDPELADEPTCVGGTVGVTRDGVPLFNAFDAGGRDALAHEVQDECDGHPQEAGQYHHHGLPSCIDDGPVGTHSALIGWALDGFGIFGPRGEDGAELATADLDACHGHNHAVKWDGKERRIYHYHATLDFPYTVACYRGTPIESAEGIQIGAPGPGAGEAGASPPADGTAPPNP
jgi:hypothetical protein